MTKKRPSDAELKAMLCEGHFGDASELAPGDPVGTTPMVVDIDRIKHYERNPRREPNPRYDEIRESIRAQGLQQPLVITRRPGGDASYIVKAGGNTRLRALEALYAETGDERFGRVHCLFEPWTTESDVLAAHLIENDTRSDLAFIDKAHAVRALKALVEDETGTPLTQENLTAALQARGYRIERSLLSRMDYALDVLFPSIPEALRAGMGQPQIQRIRRLERAAERLWRGRELGDEDHFRTVFGALLARYDGPDWQLERVRRAVEKEIAERADEDLRQIRVALDAEIAGRAQSAPPEPHPVDGSASLPDPGATQTRADAAADGSSPASSSPGNAASLSSETHRADPDRPRAAHRDRAAADGRTVALTNAGADGAESETATRPKPSPDAYEATSAGHIEGAGSTSNAPMDAKSLRARAWVLAARIAKRNRMGDIVAPLNHRGGGFLVDFVYTADADTPRSRLAHATLWWFLATIAEQFHADAQAVLPHLPAEWREKPIAQAIAAATPEAQQQTLAEYTLIGFGPFMGPLLFAGMSDADWRDLLHLLDTYRHLKRTTAETNTDIWADAP